MRLLTTFMASLALATLCPVPAAASTDAATQIAQRQDLAQAVDEFAAEVLAKKEVAGFAIGIMVDGKVALTKGYGLADIENNVPVTDQTIFRIGSLTKQFTAAAVLVLVERGELSLDDHVSKYLPEFPGADTVTIRQLLNHTSGIHEFVDLDFIAGPGRTEYSTDALLDHIASLDPVYDFKPGSAWSYSNSGFMLLQAIIERVSSQPYADFLKANVIDPLGLDHTQVDVLAEIVPNRARGYELAKDAPTGFVNAEYLSLSVAGAAGAIRSDVADLLKWHHELFSGKLIGKAELAQMTMPARLNDGRLASLGRYGAAAAAPTAPEFGMGLSIDVKNGRRMIGHGGTINGFNAVIETFPDDEVTIVLLTNTPRAAYGNLDGLIETTFKTLGR